MSIDFCIDALRELAPACPDGEAVLLEAAEHLRQMRARIENMPDHQIPPTEPQR